MACSRQLTSDAQNPVVWAVPEASDAAQRWPMTTNDATRRGSSPLAVAGASLRAALRISPDAPAEGSEHAQAEDLYRVAQDPR